MAASSRAALFLRPFVPLFSWMTARYIACHRRRLLAESRPIATTDFGEFGTFFPEAVLTEARIVRACMPNPRFFFLARLFGIEGVLEMSAIRAITLMDVVAYPERMDRNTLFHELVHVVQYRVLGLRNFARLYVTGFLRGGGYEGIPLERQAYELEERFRQEPKKVFSVEKDTRVRWQAGRL
jgi:hypothetical protein